MIAKANNYWEIKKKITSTIKTRNSKDHRVLVQDRNFKYQ